MTKSEFVDKVASTSGLSKKDVMQRGRPLAPEIAGAQRGPAGAQRPRAGAQRRPAGAERSPAGARRL